MDYSKLNYLIIVVLICFLFSFFREKPKPTYNPFDDLFQVEVQQLARDGCDTFPAGCGYWDLAKVKEDFGLFYQIYQLGTEKVEAKGFVFFMDTFRMSIPSNYHHYYLDSFPLFSYKVSRLEEIIDNFRFSIDSIGIDYIRIVSDNKKDTAILDIRTRLARHSPRPVYVRSVNYFVGTPEPLIEKIGRIAKIFLEDAQMRN